MQHNTILNQNKYNFEKYLKNCENKKICSPHYSKLKTGTNDPSQSRRMRYSEYVSNAKGLKIINKEKITIYLSSVYIPDYTAHSITFAFDGSYNTVRISQDNITRGVVESNIKTFVDTNLLANKVYYYRVIPYDINGVFIDETPFPVITLGEITNFKYGKITTNSIEMFFDGSYQNVSLYTISGELIKRDLKNTYIDISLNPGVKYSYSLIALNDLNNPAPSYKTIPIYTLPNLQKNYYGNITNSSIQLYFEGSYNTVSIIRNDGREFSNISDISYTITNLIPDTSYAFNVIPFIDGISGNTLFYNTKYTLPKITDVSFTSLTAYSLTFNIIGNFYHINIIRNDGYIINNIYENTYTDLNLKPNTQYFYKIIPFNREDISGSIFTTESIYTYAILLNSSYSEVTASSVKLSFNGVYNSLKLIRNDGIEILDISSNIYYDYNLQSNITYMYNVIAYNGDNIPTTYIVETSPFTTLPVLYDIAFSNITTSSIQLSISGVFDSVLLNRNNGKFLVVYEPIRLYGNNYIEYIDDVAMTINTDYNYIITPYNNNNIPGKFIFTPFRFTLPKIINFTYKDISTNFVSFNIDGCYNILNIKRYDNTNNEYIRNINTLTYVDNTVIPNRQYYYTVTSINGDGITGNSLELYYICTLPSITNLYYSDISFSSITLNIQGLYNTILIQRTNADDIYSNYITKYIDTTVYPNTPYQYYLTPYNNFNESIYTIPMNVVYTSAVIYDVYFLDITTDSFTIVVDGIYNFYNIQRNDNIIDISFLRSNIFVDNNNLQINTLYNYKITPCNNIDVPGLPFITKNVYIPPVLYDINVPALSILPDFIITQYTIQFPILNGVFYKYNLYRDDVLIKTNIFYNNNYNDNNNNLNLLPNTYYKYTLLPFNTLDLSGANYDITLCTLSTLSNITSEQFTCYTNYYVSPILDGSYSYLQIYRNGTLIISNLTDKSFTDNGGAPYFEPNTLTNYLIISYNKENIIGQNYYVNVWTLPQITNVIPNYIGQTTIQFTLYGYFSNITIMRNNKQLSTGDLRVNIKKLTQSSFNNYMQFNDYGYTEDTNNGLTPFTYYTYVVTPYNGDNFAGENFTFTYRTLS